MTEYLERYIEPFMAKDLTRKMVFVSGPRQTGKTTLAKHLCALSGADQKRRYLNWDDSKDRENILKERFPTGPGYLVLDEIHKCKRWRQVVKGLFDKRGDEVQILVTGSARLDYYRRGGDSLQGRYYFYRLFPITVPELKNPAPSTVMDFYTMAGFRSPFYWLQRRRQRGGAVIIGPALSGRICAIWNGFKTLTALNGWSCAFRNL